MSTDITKVAIIGQGTVGTALASLAGDAGIEVVTGAEGTVPDLAGCTLVIEAVREDDATKREVLTAIAEAADDAAVLVTTTSVLDVTALALATGAPARVVGLHLSLPADQRTLAEVVRTVLAADSAVAAVSDLAEALGRSAVVVADRPGFISARLLYGYLNHAISMVQNGYASTQDVDAAMRFGCGYPIGPLAMADAIGLDVLRDALAALYAVTGERVHAPSPILKQLVAAGKQGQKSGAGFYTYAEPGSAEIVVADTAADDAAVAPREVTSVGVIGSGTMATGIIEVFAKSGFDVTFVARGDEKVARVAAALAKSLDKQVDKGRLTAEDRDAIVARTTGVTSVEQLDQVDLVVEAVVEDLDVKLELFRTLDRVCKDGAVLATTTSSLPVIEMAAVTGRPQDVVGLHFFNPAPIMKLVEIVRTTETGDDVVATAWDICRRTKKVGVECGDRGGFIVNALLFPYLNDAVRMVDAHYATKEQIDDAMKAGAGFPMGPFALLDVVGNDVSLAIQEVLLDEFNDPGFEPADSLRAVVAAGFLGRKTGRGFYDYAR
ncbi:MAG: 3-hydroxyacyl-CoA dehydrogenase family protein [Candidatus Nanopelagicales bacterium]